MHYYGCHVRMLSVFTESEVLFIWYGSKYCLGTHQIVHSRSRTPAPQPGPSSCWSPDPPGRSRSSHWGLWRHLDPSELQQQRERIRKHINIFWQYKAMGRWTKFGKSVTEPWNLTSEVVPYVCGCPYCEQETAASRLPSPPHLLPLPGECGCSGSSGQVGSYSAFHRLEVNITGLFETCRSFRTVSFWSLPQSMSCQHQLRGQDCFRHYHLFHCQYFTKQKHIWVSDK